MAASNVFSGARSRFLVNNTPVGFAAGVSGSESVEYEAVDVLDLLEIREFVPVAYRATLSAQVFRVIGQSLKAVGIFPQHGAGSAGDTNILTSGDLNCVVEDKITGENMAIFQNCKASEYTFDITARGIVSQNITFQVIRLKDEFDNPINGGS